jgi:hypothetical protein
MTSSLSSEPLDNFSLVQDDPPPCVERPCECPSLLPGITKDSCDMTTGEKVQPSPAATIDGQPGKLIPFHRRRTLSPV